MAGEQHVIHVFIERAGGASGGGCKQMPEPSSVGWQTTSLRKPGEDFTLQRSCAPPNRSRQLVNLQVPESKGIDIFV
jgi:hypothetical protein